MADQPIDWHGRSFDEKMNRLDELADAEDLNLFEWGDILKTMDDPELALAAKKLNRKLGTLRIRVKVSAAFPADRYNRRAHTWGVYRILARVTDVELRDEILAMKSEGEKWTTDQMTREVQKRLKAKLPKSEVRNEVVSSGAFILGGYFKLSGTMNANGTIKIETNTPIATIDPHDLGPAGMTIIIQPADDNSETYEEDDAEVGVA